MRIEDKILKSIKKFKLNLSGKKVLTEAASGNYAVTPVIAALAGASVNAFTKNSKYASIEEVKRQTLSLAEYFHIENRIQIIEDLVTIDLEGIDIFTNTGFLRPINNDIIQKLSPKCVIPLMWEPWEYRPDDIDIDACAKKGIKVYGTNESDKRLKTMSYLGFIILHFLLNNKRSPFSSNVLVLGCKKFCNPIEKILKKNNYSFDSHYISDKLFIKDIQNYDSIVIAEHENKRFVIGNENAVIHKNLLRNEQLIIHICGNVDLSDTKCIKLPEKPAEFGYMSYTCDFIDNMAVIDLHTAGIKVAEGMLLANNMHLKGKGYKDFMEKNYPALSFFDKNFW